MNFHLMVKEYQESDIMSKVEGASKHEFIQIVLQELYNNLNILSRSFQFFCDYFFLFF